MLLKKSIGGTLIVASLVNLAVATNDLTAKGENIQLDDDIPAMGQITKWSAPTMTAMSINLSFDPARPNQVIACYKDIQQDCLRIIKL